MLGAASVSPPWVVEQILGCVVSYQVFAVERLNPALYAV